MASGTQYFYEVDAVDAVATSSFSNIANAVTILAAPSGLTATEVSTSQINLTWTDNDGGLATSYAIDRSTTSTGGFAQIGTAASGATAYTDSTVASNTTYYYEVDAVDAVTTSAFSNVAGASTLGIPTTVNATAVSVGQIDLTWVDHDGGVATSYNIDRSTTNTGGFTQIATVGSGATAYTDSPLFPSTTYYYEVQAVDGTLISALSSPGNATTPTNEVGSVASDDFFGTNGSAWSSQWTFVNKLTEATPNLTISNDVGKAVFTQVSGHTMTGNYVALNNTTNGLVDSYQNVFLYSDTTATDFDLIARSNTAATTYYEAQVVLATSTGKYLQINSVVGGTTTLVGKVSVGTVVTDTWYELEFEVITNGGSTNLDAKLWAATTAETTGTEPTTWQIATTDSTAALQGVSGEDGISMTVATATTNTFKTDKYEAVNIVTTNASYMDNFQNSSTTGWSPLTASRWSVGTKGDSVRYYINTSSYTAGSGGTLGEYSLLNASGYTNVGDFTMRRGATWRQARSSTAGSNYAIVFGYQNSSNYYFMEFNATSGATQLYKVVSGTASVIPTTVTGGQIADTSYHTIKIQRKGMMISVWYDGQSVLSVSDATFIGGQIGIGALNDAAYFDNVIVG